MRRTKAEQEKFDYDCSLFKNYADNPTKENGDILIELTKNSGRQGLAYHSCHGIVVYYDYDSHSYLITTHKEYWDEKRKNWK